MDFIIIDDGGEDGLDGWWIEQLLEMLNAVMMEVRDCDPSVFHLVIPTIRWVEFRRSWGGTATTRCDLEAGEQPTAPRPEMVSSLFLSPQSTMLNDLQVALRWSSAQSSSWMTTKEHRRKQALACQLLRGDGSEFTAGSAEGLAGPGAVHRPGDGHEVRG